jgi:hypothetical protein
MDNTLRTAMSADVRVSTTNFYVEARRASTLQDQPSGSVAGQTTELFYLGAFDI